MPTGGVSVGYSPETFYDDYYRTFEGGGEYLYEYAPATSMNLSPSVANGGGLQRGVRSSTNAVGLSYSTKCRPYIFDSSIFRQIN